MGNHRKLIISMQALSIAATSSILLTGFHYPIGEDWVQNLGQTLTMILFFVTAICHFQAKKGVILPGPLILLALIPPVYAAVSGPIRYVLTYQALVLVAHGLVFWNLEKAKKIKKTEPIDEADHSTGEG